MKDLTSAQASNGIIDITDIPEFTGIPDIRYGVGNYLAVQVSAVNFYGETVDFAAKCRSKTPTAIGVSGLEILILSLGSTRWRMTA